MQSNIVTLLYFFRGWNIVSGTMESLESDHPQSGPREIPNGLGTLLPGGPRTRNVLLCELHPLMKQ